MVAPKVTFDWCLNAAGILARRLGKLLATESLTLDSVRFGPLLVMRSSKSTAAWYFLTRLPFLECNLPPQDLYPSIARIASFFGRLFYDTIRATPRYRIAAYFVLRE